MFVRQPQADEFVSHFDASGSALSDIDESAIAGLLGATADLALVLDHRGIVRQIVASCPQLPLDAQRWIDRDWADAATASTRGAVRELLAEAIAAGKSGQRQVDHLAEGGADIPFVFTAVRLNDESVLAVGRDVRAVTGLQQQLFMAQQALERDYSRLRQVETRYRMLFELSDESVLIIDPVTLRIVDANRAAGRFFATDPKRLVGRAFALDLDRTSESLIGDLLVRARTSGRPVETHVRLQSGQDLVVGASLVVQGDSSLVLLRLRPEAGDSGCDARLSAARIFELVRCAPDALLVADDSGRILSANCAFLVMVQVSAEDAVVGHSLGQWLGRPGADFSALLSALKEHGVVRLFATAVRGELGSSTEVEVSAAIAEADGVPCIGLNLRDVGRRLGATPRGARDLTRAVEELTGLLGRVSVRDLVRDTVSLVERHFIEAALALTGDNRTSAAQVLGVSRQSLYVKLRRYKLDGPRPESE